MTTELFMLLILVIGLTASAVFMMTWIVRTNAQEKKLLGRMELAAASITRPADTVDEQISLSKIASQSEQLKLTVAGLFNADLDLAETYPIKWWLIPPIAIAFSWVVMEIASHPIGHRGILLAAGWPVCSLFLARAAFTWIHNKRNTRLLEQFPDALNSIVRAVRVGIPMADALRMVARDALDPTRTEFSILADKVAIGIPLDLALRELATRIKLTEYQFFATALTLQARSGGGITQTLETLAEVIRKRVGLKARGLALTAEARTSALILALLPFVAGGGIFIIQRPYADLLFYTKSGQSCLGTAILLMGLGMGLIQYMINNVLK